MIELFLKLHPGVQVMLFFIAALLVTYILAVAGPQILSIATSRWQKSEEANRSTVGMIQDQFKALKEYMDTRNATLQSQIDDIKDHNDELKRSVEQVAKHTEKLAEETRGLADESRRNFQHFSDQLGGVQQRLDGITASNRKTQPTCGEGG